MLKQVFEDIHNNYLTEKEVLLKGNAFADRVRSIGKQALEDAVGDSNLKYKASVGAGNWAEVPWLGVFSPESTESATHGIYVVYLFSADMSSLYLCQGQGVTRVKEEFGRQQIEELQRRAELIRSRIQEYKDHFQSGAIDLGGKTNLAKEYDSAVAYFKKYDLSRLPSDDLLRDDLIKIVDLYKLLIARGGAENLESFGLAETANEDEVSNTIVEQRRYIRHKKIERNAKAAKAAKAELGFNCQGCGLNFKNIYGEAGDGYIEAHHLIPLHTLDEGASVRMNVKEDFAVLCSNCHKIVHRAQPMLSIPDLRALPGVRMLRKAFVKKYGA